MPDLWAEPVILNGLALMGVQTRANTASPSTSLMHYSPFVKQYRFRASWVSLLGLQIAQEAWFSVGSVTSSPFLQFAGPNSLNNTKFIRLYFH